MCDDDSRTNPADQNAAGITPPGHGVPAAAPLVLRSDDLLHGAREVQIAHAGEIYRLSVTRNGKLILTK